MASKHTASGLGLPIVLVSARLGRVKGTYDVEVTVHGRNKTAADQALHHATAHAGIHVGGNAFSSSLYGGNDISRRDPYRATAKVRFFDVSKEAFDVLRKNASASHLIRSRSATDREMAYAILDREPLRIPTQEMWAAAMQAQPGDWFVEAVFMGQQEPATTLARDVAYRLLDEENARRARLR